ncbi:Uncharacterised protein [Vibrio cholerae]|nr:Uncharacterised protein [Vibrio cholerae]
MGHQQAKILLVCGQGIGIDVPKFFRNKCFDFAFTLNQKFHGDRLYTTSGKASRHFFPQQWRDHKAHHAVHETACLLSVHAIHIQFTRLLKSLLNGVFGDFVKYHSFISLFIATDDLTKVPSDGFSLAVQVGCEINAVSVFRELLQLSHHFLFTGQNLVIGLPAVIRIDTHLFDQRCAFFFTLLLLFISSRCFLSRCCRRFTGRCGRLPCCRQITHVSHTGFHDKVFTKVLIDGFSLGWRLDDNE